MQGEFTTGKNINVTHSINKLKEIFKNHNLNIYRKHILCKSISPLIKPLAKIYTEVNFFNEVVTIININNENQEKDKDTHYCCSV